MNRYASVPVPHAPDLPAIRRILCHAASGMRARAHPHQEGRTEKMPRSRFKLTVAAVVRLGRRLDLTRGSGEHRDDVAAVADASLLPRGGTASARLALAWSSQRLLLVECRGPVATAACRTVPRTGRGTSRAEGRCFERRADSRICGDLRGSTQRASAGLSRGPGTASGWADDHGTMESRRRTTGSVLGYLVHLNACEGA